MRGLENIFRYLSKLHLEAHVLGTFINQAWSPARFIIYDICQCVLVFFNSGEKNSPEARDEICKVHGHAVVSIPAVKNWSAKFGEGEFELEDEP